jgi:ribonuclease R
VLAEPSGKVVRVLQVGSRVAVGTVQREGYIRVRGTSRRLQVAHRRGKRPIPGERVMVALPEHARAVAEIVQTLGLEGELGVEVEAALRSRGFRREFPPEVEEEADRLTSDRPTDECGDRLDLRSLLVLTVDPHDAQDFDDALSLQSLRGGGVRLGVHIADVSHYVKSEGRVDEEAYRRGFSVYPPGGVVPMLPEQLSSDECSLLENRPRRSFSVFLDYDNAHRLRSSSMRPSLVRNSARLTYEEAQEFMDGRGAREPVARVLRMMKPLLQALRRARAARGTLDLESGEVAVALDHEGNPGGISWAPHLESHDLVEEFMIAANRAVAQKLLEHGWPALYRVHRQPAIESFERLADWLAPLGYQLRNPAKLQHADLQRLLERARHGRHRRLVSYLVLRSLPRALYSARNEGHYGLALSRYVHFTSPIRRYPDLLLHRFLKAALAGRSPGSVPEEQRLAEVADRCSYREELAWEAEREIVAVYTTCYMRSRVGETFDGLVVGVEPFGVFVELEELPVQGMIPAEDLQLPRRTRRSRTTFFFGGRALEPGERVTVRVVKADVANRRVEFSVA